MKEYTIILDDEELEVFMGCLEDTLHQHTVPSTIEDDTLRAVLIQIKIQKDRNKEDYE